MRAAPAAAALQQWSWSAVSGIGVRVMRCRMCVVMGHRVVWCRTHVLAGGWSEQRV
jgi:hypothetical protein